MATTPRGRLEFDSTGDVREPDAQRAVRDAELRADVARVRLTVGWALAVGCAMLVVDLIVRVGIQHASPIGVASVRLGLIAYYAGLFAVLRRRTLTALQLTIVRAIAFGGTAVAIAFQTSLDDGLQSALVVSLVPVAVLQAMTAPRPFAVGLSRVLAVCVLGLGLVVALTATSSEHAPQLHLPAAIARFATSAGVIVACAILVAVGSAAYWRLRRQVFARRLVGRYRLVECIGRGGMGEVWRAAHPGLRRDVAVKILRGDRAGATQIARFQAEIAALSELSSPHTVRVYDSGVTDDGLCYFAMELLAGETLAARVKRGGPLAAPAAQAIIRQIARALAEAHDHGIVHRDLTPANVFLDTASGAGEVAKLIDFGIAKRTDSAASDANISGTPAYMAPEQAAGAPPTPAGDVYGLGAIWYFALTGEPPPRGELRADLDPMVAHCLARDPAARPAHVRALDPGGPRTPAVVGLAAATPVPAVVTTSADPDIDPEHRASYVRLQILLRWSLALWCALGATDVLLDRGLDLGLGLAAPAAGALALAAILVRLRTGIPTAARLAALRTTAFAALAAATGVAAACDAGPSSAACTAMLFVVVAQGLALPGRMRATLLGLGATVAVFVAVVCIGVAVHPPAAYPVVVIFPCAIAIAVTAVFMAIVGKAHWQLRQLLFEQRVVGRYKLQRMLGAGGMGEVWAAPHPGLGTEVAIKLLRPDEASPDRVARFETEVSALTSLSHPHTVRVYDCGTTDDGFLYYVMERLHGQTIADAVETGGAFHGARALRIARQVAAALAEAHAAGIVHRDLKPDNVFLARVGADREYVKVIDFGIAKRALESRLTRTGIAVGTPTFMSPEQAQCLPVDARADIYALGAVIYYMLTARPPFTAESPAIVMMAHVRDDAAVPSTYALGLPHAVDELVLRCLAKEPSDRPASMTELAAALDELAERYDALPTVAAAVMSRPVAAHEPTPNLTVGIALAHEPTPN